MKIHLTSAYDSHQNLDTLRQLVVKDRMGRHSLCESAEEADAILFVENTHFDDYLFKRLRRHPLLHRFPGKSFMYNESDKPKFALPGLYTCVTERQFQADRQVPFAYFGSANRYVPHIHQWQVEKRWLFSFVGSMSHHCRHDVLELASVSGGVRDTSEFNVWHSNEAERNSQGLVYAEAMAASYFMLCPRGIGPASLRLFETLEAGRAPVIISDQWVPTPHIDWQFAVQVRQSEISSIPSLLRSMVGEAEDRGRAARQAWEQAYAPDVMFDTVAESVAWLFDTSSPRLHVERRQLLRNWLINRDARTRDTYRRIRSHWQQGLP